MKPVFLFTFIVALHLNSFANRDYNCTSPDGSLQLTVSQNDSGSIHYSLLYKKKDVIKNSLLGLVLSKPAISLSQFDITAIDSLLYDESWKPIWGEVSTIRNHYKQIRFTVREKSKMGIVMQIVFRVFNL